MSGPRSALALLARSECSQLKKTVVQRLNCVSRGMQVVDDRRAAHAAEQGSHAEAMQGKNDSYEGTLEDAVLRNTNQFHKWHAELDAACALEMEEKYKRYADLLNSHLASCEGILGQVGSTGSTIGANAGGTAQRGTAQQGNDMGRQRRRRGMLAAAQQAMWRCEEAEATAWVGSSSLCWRHSRSTLAERVG